MPSFHPRHINETLNSRESVALGGCFFSPLVRESKSIECSIISDRNIQAVYQTVTNNLQEQQKAFIVQKGDVLKYTEEFPWLSRVEINALKGHDVVILGDQEEDPNAQKILCVLHSKFEEEPAYDKDGLITLTIGLDENGMLQLDGRERVFE